MTSEDAIHDFFVPAFRMKADVLQAATPPNGSKLPNPGPIIFSVLNIGHESLRHDWQGDRHAANRL